MKIFNFVEIEMKDNFLNKQSSTFSYTYIYIFSVFLNEYWVLMQFAKIESVVTVQHAFRIKFRCDPP